MRYEFCGKVSQHQLECIEGICRIAITIDEAWRYVDLLGEATAYNIHDCVIFIDDGGD